MLEKQIEKRVCDYAKSKGFLAYKFTSPNRASVPDRLFISEDGFCFFIEFKRKGGKVTEGQKREMQRLEDQRVVVYVVDNIDTGKHIIDAISMGIIPELGSMC